MTDLPVIHEQPVPPTGLGGGSTLTWSPNGLFIAGFIDLGGTLRAWTRDGVEMWTINRGYGPGSGAIAFLGQSSVAVIQPVSRLPRDDAFAVLDVENRKVVRNVPGQHPGMGFRFNTADLFAASPDGSLVAVAMTHAHPQAVAIYASSDWSLVGCLGGICGDDQPYTVSSITFSPVGDLLAFGTYDGRVFIFSVRGFSLLKVIDCWKGYPLTAVTGLVFSPDGYRIAVGAAPGFNTGVPPPGTVGVDPRAPAGTLTRIAVPDPLRVFHVTDGVLDSSVTLADGLVQYIQWFPQKDVIVFKNSSQKIFYWCLRLPRDSSLSVGTHNRVESLALSPDGSSLAILGNYKLLILDASKAITALP